MRLIIVYLFSLYFIFAQGFLHNVNGDIVEGDGEPILLRGLD